MSKGGLSLFRGPMPGFLLMLLQLCLGIPSSLEYAAGLGGRGMAVLAFPGVVVGSGPYNGFFSAGALVFTQWRDLPCRGGES